MWSELSKTGAAAFLCAFLSALTTSPALGADPLPFPVGENVVDGASAVVGRAVGFNQVVVNSNGTFAALPFSFRGLIAGNGADPKNFDDSSLIIYHPKRDCRGTPFISIDRVTVPYRAFPTGSEQIGASIYYRTVEYYAPVESAYGVNRYMFSFRNLATKRCTEGTYFGSFLEARKLQLTSPAPLFLK